MIFYRTPNGVYHGTQADAGKNRVQVDVPTDKPGLLQFLNENCRAVEPEQPLSGEGLQIASADASRSKVGSGPRDMSATATLSRMDNPGVDVDSIVEVIGSSKGYALKRYAGAVAVAFQNL